MNAAGRGGLKD